MPRENWKRVSKHFWSGPVSQSVLRTLKGDMWKYGPRARAVEAAVARLLDVPPEWVIATNSCTAALQAAARTGLGAFVKIAGTAPIMTWASTLVLDPFLQVVDCDEDGWPVQPVGIGVDLWGRRFPASCDILDAAHRFAAPEHADVVQAGGVVCYSFGPMKELSCPSGGALVTKHVPQVARCWLDSSQTGRAWNGDNTGMNGLMTDVSAAHLLPQFNMLKRFSSIRQTILDTYIRFLGPRLMTRPGEASGHIAVIRDADPDWIARVRTRLKNRGIETGHHYPVAEHLKERFPRAYALSKRILTLPCHVGMDPIAAATIAHQVLGA